MVEVLNTDQIKDIAPLNQIKVLAYKDKGDWILETKYNIGSKKKKVEELVEAIIDIKNNVDFKEFEVEEEDFHILDLPTSTIR